MENALVGLARTTERGEAFAKALTAARAAEQLARQRYTTGLIDFQSVLTTQRTTLTVEESLPVTAPTRSGSHQSIQGPGRRLDFTGRKRPQAGKDTP